MAIAVDHVDTNKDEATASFSDIVVSDSFTLTNASGNDRLLVLMFTAHSGQSGDLTVGSAATYNAVAATGSITFNNTSGSREIIYVAWWDDSDLPASAGANTLAFTSSNSGASPWAAWTITELTGADQTTPKSESEDTAEAFGTTQQTYTPSTGGDIILGVMSAEDAGQAGDPSFTMTDTTTFSPIDSVGSNFGSSFGYSTDGTLACTADANYILESWLAVAFTAAAVGGATIPVFYNHYQRLMRQ